jgi:serine O-acetyltransferase
MKYLFADDYFRKYGEPPSRKKWKIFFIDHSMWFLYLLRKNQEKSNTVISKLMLFLCQKKYGLEILPITKIGKGLYLGHAYNITVNPLAVLGNNINLHKGVTIGQQNRGMRKGVPIIGNGVWVGVNSTIVGNVVIGDNVLIAPNSYVNIDVPSNSVVIGNPCRIIPKQNATEHYINNRISSK